MNRLLALLLMLSMHYIFCPPYNLNRRREDRNIEVTYQMLAGDTFKLDYVTKYDDGAISRRSIEWKDSILFGAHFHVLRRKLEKTTRESDREAVAFMLDLIRLLGK